MSTTTVIFRFLLLMTLTGTLIGCGSATKVKITVPPKAEQPRVIVNPRTFSFYAAGVLAEKEEQYQAAINYYNQALEYSPNHSDVLYSLASLLFRLRQPEEALEAALRIHYRDKNTYNLIADSYRVLGRHAEAETTYLKILRMDPHDFNARWYAGAYARQQGDYESAIVHFSELAILNPTPAIYVEIAKLYNAQGKTAEAISNYRKSLEYDSSMSNMEAYIDLAGLLQTENRFGEAEKLLTRGISAEPETRMLRLYLVEMYRDNGDTTKALEQIEWLRTNADGQLPVIDRIGQAAFELGQFDLADSIFAHELSLYPESIVGLFYRGRIAIFQERMSDAKELFWKLIDVSDSLPDGYINLGMIYLDEDSLDLAIDILKEGVARSADGRENAQYYLATALGRAERYGEVLPIAQSLAKTHPDELRYLFMMGSALERMANHDSAAVIFERILELDPEHAQTLNYLGYMWADLGVNLERSLDMIEKALEIDSDNGAYLDSYGWVLYRLGKYEDAERQIRKAIDAVEEADHVLYEHLGDIYYSMDRYEDAKRSWEKALEIDPDNPAIKEKLAR